MYKDHILIILWYWSQVNENRDVGDADEWNLHSLRKRIESRRELAAPWVAPLSKWQRLL